MNRKILFIVAPVVLTFGTLTGCKGGDTPIQTFTVTFDGNGGTLVSGTEVQEVKSASEIKVPTYKRNGYTFNDWDKDIKTITTTTTVKANWKVSQYRVNVFTNDEVKGTVTGGGNFDYGSSVTVIATPSENCIFKGWYSDEKYKTFITNNTNYELTVPFNGVDLYAKFVSNEEEIEWNKRHGIIPSISPSTQILTYGLYPQTHVNDPILIEELKKVAPDVNEEYFFYNDEYYVKDIGNPYESTYKFQDGTEVVKGETYFFKCEPIKWNIKETADTTYTIDCSNILYAHRFDDESNLYKSSELRTWLNYDFYNKAFSLKTTSSYIVPTDLNDVSVTGDKVWIGSHSQYSDEHWYQGNKARQKKVSDFALCNYAYMCEEPDCLRNGDYWTRTPRENVKNYVHCVDASGGIFENHNEHNIPYYSVSPSLTIKMD